MHPGVPVMNCNLASPLLFCAMSLATLTASAVTIPTVPVGNAGNAGEIQPEGEFGAVAYNYRIGTYEVTVGQYTEFLNSVAASDTYSLYNTFMATDLNRAGIARSGSSGSYSYSVIGSANKPISYVSWGDAARFSNWLHNGQPTGAQGAGTTEDGAYALNGATTAAALNAVVRAPAATWFIPTENEWYKAAYHQPTAQGGDSDNYWSYPTRTNNEPNSDQPPGDVSIQSNVGNFSRDDGQANGYNDGYAATGSTIYSESQNYLTDAGAYTSAMSPYGTFDQGGNVYEWNETLINGSSRGLRGGTWSSGASSLLASFRPALSPDDENGGIGFRVATVPEPSSFVLAALGLIRLFFGTRRMRS